MPESMKISRFELGLPLFADLDIGKLLQAQQQLASGDISGMGDLISVLARSCGTKAIRALAAIWTATDLEIECAETDDKFMTSLLKRQDSRTFAECFADAMDFQVSLWAQLGISQVSSSPETVTTATPRKRPSKTTAGPSAD